MSRPTLTGVCLAVLFAGCPSTALADDAPDPRAPCELTCTANITVSTDPGQCTAIVFYAGPTETGTCVASTCLPASGTAFEVGEHTIICAQPVGAFCNFTITVIDTEPPTIVCPPAGSVTGQFDPSCAPLIPDLTTLVTVSDNCPGPITITQFPPPNTADVAERHVSPIVMAVSATDAAGNSKTCDYSLPIENRCGCGLCGAGIPVNLTAITLALAAQKGLRARRKPSPRLVRRQHSS